MAMVSLLSMQGQGHKQAADGGARSEQGRSGGDCRDPELAGLEIDLLAQAVMRCQFAIDAGDLLLDIQGGLELCVAHAVNMAILARGFKGSSLPSCRAAYSRRG